MTRFDVSPSVRTAAAVVFIAEGILLFESVLAEKKNRPRRALTISELCWRNKALIPVVLTALGAHLVIEPEISRIRRGNEAEQARAKRS